MPPPSLDDIQWDGSLRPSLVRRFFTTAFVSLNHLQLQIRDCVFSQPRHMTRETLLTEDVYHKLISSFYSKNEGLKQRFTQPNTSEADDIRRGDASPSDIQLESLSLPASLHIHKASPSQPVSGPMSRWIRFFMRFRDHQGDRLEQIRQPFLALVCPPEKIAGGDEEEDITVMPLENCPLIRVCYTNKKQSRKETGKAGADYCVVYVHGGGFVSGDFSAYHGISQALSRRLRCPVYFPQYRLAPESSIVESVSDIVETLHFASQQHSKVVLVGDSAGGGLCLLSIQHIFKQQRLFATGTDGSMKKDSVMPVCCVLLSPAIDLAAQGDSYERNGPLDCTLNGETVKRIFKKAAQKYDTKDPLVNAIYGPWDKSCSPLLVVVADDEVLLDDSLIFQSLKLSEAKEATIEVDVYPNAFHTWHLFHRHIPEAEEHLKRCLDFIRSFIE